MPYARFFVSFDIASEINSADLVLLSRHLLGVPSLTAEQGECADIHSDGIIDCFDMIMLRQTILDKMAV